MKSNALTPAILALGIFIAIISFSLFNPTITGFVPATILTQNLSISINQSQDFLVTSESQSRFTVTSLKISGNISGNGKVKVFLDNGKGEEVLIYENVEKSRESKGLVSVTARVIEPNKKEQGQKESLDSKALILKPLKNPLRKEEFTDTNDTNNIVNGPFFNQCIETCAMSMKLSKGISYRLVALVEENTTLTIKEIIYQIEEEK